MRQQYRRHSFSAWVFWGALVVGGTLYGAYRFDWFNVAFLLSSSGSQNLADAAKSPTGQKPAAQSPPDGSIEVAQSPVGPQTEPPPTDVEEPADPRPQRGGDGREQVVLVHDLHHWVEPHERGNDVQP